jgi:hypothetical protein
MPFDVRELSTELNLRGVIKPSRFFVTLNLPPVWSDDPEVQYYASLCRDLGLRADRASIPGLAVRTLPVRRYGYGTIDTQPLTPVFDDVQVSFISDAWGDSWMLFNKWIRKITNSDTPRSPEDAYELAYKDEYANQVQIQWYSEIGEMAKTIVLNQAYPTGLSEIKLDWGDDQTIARFVVNFSVQDFGVDETIY